jgi:L-ascorbate metabolism protein UlaG (beta-lactamase superfamily)
MEVRYLYHSAFAVKTPAHLLIFDYYCDTPRGAGFSRGVVDPEEIRGEDTVVFASHSHPDHYSPRIFAWRGTVPKIRYVLSSDIHTRENAARIGPGEEKDLGDLRVRALRSTDQGVAFLVKADGLCIYHAGDLNWWKWGEDTPAEQEEAGRGYREQIDLLRGERIDLAFVPVDPRQGADALLGIDYFMRTVGAARAVPMHAFGRTPFFSILGTDPRTEPYRGRILFYKDRGDLFEA